MNFQQQIFFWFWAYLIFIQESGVSLMYFVLKPSPYTICLVLNIFKQCIDKSSAHTTWQIRDALEGSVCADKVFYCRCCYCCSSRISFVSTLRIIAIITIIISVLSYDDSLAHATS